LARLGGSKAVDSLVILLEDKNEKVYYSAVAALANLGDAMAIRHLIKQSVKHKFFYFSETDKWELNELDRISFGKIEKLDNLLNYLDKKVIFHNLVILLADENAEVRYYVVKLLGDLGDSSSIEFLIPLLKDENAWVRAKAADVLGSLSGSDAIKSLISPLKNKKTPDSMLPKLAHVIEKLVHLDTLQVIELLLQELKKETDIHAQDHIVRILGFLGDSKAVEPLIPLLKDENEIQRINTAWALGHLGDSKAIEHLILLLNDENAEVQKSAIESLNRLGYPKKIESLIPLLQYENVEMRNNVVKTLGDLGNSKAIEALTPLLEGNYSDVQYSVAKALVQLGSAKAIRPLIVAHQQLHVKRIKQSLAIYKDILNSSQWRDSVWLRNIEFSKIVNTLVEKFDISSLLPLLEDENVEVRIAATKILEQLGEPNAVDFLIPLLKDENKKVQFHAAEALIYLGNSKGIIPFLINAEIHAKKIVDLNDNLAIQQRDSVTEVIDVLIRNFGFSTLKTLLKHEHPKVRNNVATLLGFSDYSKAFELLILLLKDKDANVYISAVKALGNFNDLRAIEHLVPLLKNENKEVRFQTIMTLVKLDELNIVEHLVLLLTDEHKDVRLIAMEALAKLGDLKAVEHLIPLLQKEDEYIQHYLEETLSTWGIAETFNLLEASLKSPNVSVRQKGVNAMARLNSIKAINSLTGLLKDEDEKIAASVAKILCHLDTAEVVKPLITFSKWHNYHNAYSSSVANTLKQLYTPNLVQQPVKQNIEILIKHLSRDNDPLERFNAVEKLGNLGNPKAIEPLIEILMKDQDNLIRRYAANALGQLGNPKAVEPLIETLIKVQDEWVRSHAAYALGQLGNIKAIEPLIKTLKDRHQNVRYPTLLALLKIGDTKASNAVLAVLNNETEKKSVKIVAATTLLAFHRQEGLTFLTNVVGGDRINDKKQVAQLLGEVPTESSIQLLVILLDDDNLEVRLRAIKSLEKTKTTTVLHKLLANTNNAKFQITAVKALIQIASPDSIPIFRAAITNHNLTIPALFMALSALEKMVDKETLINMISEAVQQDERVLGLRVYNMLGKLKARQALPLLHNRLTQLEQQAHDWREIRDQERKDFTEAETETWQQTLKKAQPTFHWGFELAYAMAQIDPDDSGIKLLSHDLADVRYGAWMGLGQVGSVALVQRLDNARMASDNPLFRHAAYRAIDHMLNRLEITGNKQELNALKDLLSVVRDKEGVQTRVEWTIQQLGQSMDILAEFPQLKDKENIHIQIAQKVQEIVCSNIESIYIERLKRDEIYR
jgi:HEAT repeat protein